MQTYSFPVSTEPLQIRLESGFHATQAERRNFQSGKNLPTKTLRSCICSQLETRDCTVKMNTTFDRSKGGEVKAMSGQ